MSDQSSPGIGHNLPDLPRLISKADNLAADVTAFLDSEFSEVPRAVSELLDAARALPLEVHDDAVMGEHAKLIKRLRDQAAKIEALRVKEKEPYFRGSQAVDAFFLALHEKCTRGARKGAKLGAADILQDRVNDYNQRKLAEEQARRRREAEAAEAEARALRQKAEAEARAAEEARLAAERARKPETVAAKGAVADAAETQAGAAAVAADLALAKAQEAHIGTLAKPADLVRTRVDDGPTVTMATEPYAVIEDEARLDMAKLWPFIAVDAKERALRAWAKTTGYNQQMDGAKIGRRPKTHVR